MSAVHVLTISHDARDESRLVLRCTAGPDAACRRRPVNPDTESWNDDDETTPGHDCWAVEWVSEGGIEALVYEGPRRGEFDYAGPVDVWFNGDGVAWSEHIEAKPPDTLWQDPPSLDLTPAVEAAARAWFAHQQARRMDPGRIGDTGEPWTWDDLHAVDQRAYLALVQPIVTAAAPLIEASVRESVAAQIEAAKRDVDQSIAAPGHYAGLGHAARIARGEQR